MPGMPGMGGMGGGMPGMFGAPGAGAPGAGTSAPASTPPATSTKTDDELKVEYATQIQQMKDMGFTDDATNLDMLK